MRVCCIGEAMVEVQAGVVPGPAHLAFAGDTLNTAIHLARVGSNIDVDYRTAVGRDALSDALVSFIESEGVGTDGITRDADRSIGLYAISTDADGERSFAYWRAQSAARRMDVTVADLDAYDAVYLSAITLAVLEGGRRDALLDAMRATTANVCFDSNYRPALWEDAATARTAIEAAWRATDIALPSAEDESALFGDADAEAVCRRLRDWGVSQGAVKDGEQGAVGIDDGVRHEATPAGKIIDTTGAGDSFNGAYLAVRLGGADESVAIRAGHDCAAKVVTHRGAVAPRTQP